MNARGLLILWLAVWLAIWAGCRSTLPKLESPAAVLPDERPEDLAVAATVFSPRVPLPEDTLPRSLRPARYIIEADGVLRAAEGASAPAFPPRVRQLTPRQADQVWRLVRDSGLLDEGNPARLSDPETASRSGDRTTAMVFASYGGQRTTLRVLLDRSSQDAIAAERLVDHLAELSWVRE
jgi:hypothetical protein